MDLFYHLRFQIRLTIKQDAATKKNNEDYPGYWLFQAREMLSERDYQQLIGQLRLDAREIDYYKYLFRASVTRALEVI